MNSSYLKNLRQYGGKRITDMQKHNRAIQESVAALRKKAGSYN